MSIQHRKYGKLIGLRVSTVDSILTTDSLLGFINASQRLTYLLCTSTKRERFLILSVTQKNILFLVDIGQHIELNK